MCNLFIELPEADPRFCDPGLVGRLQKSLYGTRDAPQRRAAEIGATLESLGCRESVSTPSVLVHNVRDLSICLPVGDFGIAGPVADLEWMRGKLEQQYKLKSELVGSGPGCAKQGSFLKRTI